ncbi:NAD(P)H-binding protein [Streptomyces sp. L7]
MSSLEGHGQIALRLERLLAARGEEVAGIIRNAGQSDDLQAAGAEPLVLDLESASVEEVAALLRGADAAVFAAGAGPGAAVRLRKDTVDRGSAVLFADARRSWRAYGVMSSCPRWARIRRTPETACSTCICGPRARPNAYVRGLDALDWTILRPGSLYERRRPGPGPPGGPHGARFDPARRCGRRTRGVGGDSGDGGPDAGADRWIRAGVGGGEVGGGELRLSAGRSPTATT